MTEEDPHRGPKRHGSINPVVVGILCAILGAFGGCTLQLGHDVNGGHGGPVYLLSGLGIGVLFGLVAAAMIRERDR